MSIKLDIDGNKIEEPDRETIAKEFDSTVGNDISLVILSLGEGNTLTTSGLPTEGWAVLLREANGVTRGADISTPLRQEEVIQKFQSYARGDDLWEEEFRWKVIDEGRWPVKRLLVLAAILFAILFFGRSCMK